MATTLKRVDVRILRGVFDRTHSREMFLSEAAYLYPDADRGTLNAVWWAFDLFLDGSDDRSGEGRVSSHAFIGTMGVDVTVDALCSTDSRLKASKLKMQFMDGTTVSFTLNDKHLREIVNGLEEYLKNRGVH